MTYNILLSAHAKTKNKSHSSKIIHLTKNFYLPEQEIYEQLKYLTAIGHPMGSERQKIISDWLIKNIDSYGLRAESDQFIAVTPNPKKINDKIHKKSDFIEKRGVNVIASFKKLSSKNCSILIGSHYDSKELPYPAPSANDGASTTVILLQIAKYLSVHRNFLNHLSCELFLVWFDGEESVLPNWNDGMTKYPVKIQDNTYGSRHFVDRLIPCQKTYCIRQNTKKSSPILAFILLDMLGSLNLKISDDLNSDIRLRKLMKKVIKDLNFNNIVAHKSHYISDDHLPFAKIGIPSLDIIDFENLQHWHKSSDTVKQISIENLNKSAQIAMHLLLLLLSNP